MLTGHIINLTGLIMNLAGRMNLTGRVLSNHEYMGNHRKVYYFHRKDYWATLSTYPSLFLCVLHVRV